MYPAYHAWSSMPFLHALGFLFFPLIIIAALWTIVIKGFALWYAARNGQKGWFIVLLVINTLGILEIIYLLGFRADRNKETVVIEEETIVVDDSSAA